MGRKATQYVVVTRKDNPGFVKMFKSLDEAVSMTGPEYDKKGFLINTFEKKTETYFSLVETVEEEEEKSE